MFVKTTLIYKAGVFINKAGNTFQRSFGDYDDVDHFDWDNGSSMVNHLPEFLRNKLKDPEIGPKVMEYIAMGELDLYVKLNPTEPMDLLRHNFWEVLKHSRQHHHVLKITKMCNFEGVHACHPTTFYERYATNPMILAWMMTPPTNPLIQKFLIYKSSLRKMREVLAMPSFSWKEIKTRAGNKKNIKHPNTPLIAQQRAIAEMLRDDLFGKPTQRIEQKTLDMNKVMEDERKSLIGSTPDEHEKKLEELRKKAGFITHSQVEVKKVEEIASDDKDSVHSRTSGEDNS